MTAFSIMIWNESEDLVFDAADYSCRYAASAALPGGVANGSLSLPTMPTGALWAMPMLYNATDAQCRYAQFTMDQANRRIDYRTDGLPATSSIDLHYGLQPGGTLDPQADFTAQIADSDERVQFDASWAAMHLAAKGQISIDNPSSGNWSQINVTYSGARAPLIAFRPGVGVNVAVYASRSGPTITYHFCRYHITGSSSGSAGTVDYWIYDLLPFGHQPDDFTVALFDGAAGNQCLFDALRAPMRIAREAAEPVGKVYAVCPVFGSSWREDTDVFLDSWGNVTGQIDVRTSIGGWEFDPRSKNFITKYYHSASHIGIDGGYSPDESVYLLLDVTNH